MDNSWRTWREHGESKFESAYKNKGFVNFIVGSLAIMLILARDYNGFLQDMFCPEVAMLESPYKNHGFVNVIDESLAIMLILARNYNCSLQEMFCPSIGCPS